MHGVAFLALDGEPTTLDATGDRILAHHDDRLVLIDASNPRQPAVLGSATVPEATTDIASDGDYAYLTVDQGTPGLYVVDLRDPSSMGVIGYLDGFASPKALILSGGTVFVADRLWPWTGPAVTRLLSVDVSDPAHPARLDEVDLADGLINGTWLRAGRDLLYEGSVCLFAGETGGMHIVSATDPANLVYWSTVPLGFAAQDVAIRGATAFVVGEELAVVDVGNPFFPDILASHPVSGSEGLSIMLHGDRATIRSGDLLLALDLTVPTDFAETGRLTLPYTLNKQLGYFGDHVASLRPEGIYIADVEPAVPLPEVGMGMGRETPAEVADVLVDGSLAYVSTTLYGALKIYDMADPTTPVLLGSVSAGSEIFDLDKEGDLAAMAFVDFMAGIGVFFIDVSDPAHPAVVSTHSGLDSPLKVSLEGTRAYVTDTGGVMILDVSDPETPAEIGFVPVTGTPEAVGNTMFLATEDAGLRIFDVTDPGSVSEIGAEPGGALARDLTVEGDRVFLAGASGIRIVDVADPTAPGPLGSSPTKAPPLEMAFRDGFLYVATGVAGVEIFDVTDPLSPLPVMDLGIGESGAAYARYLGLGPDYLLASNASVHLAELPCAPVSAVPPIRRLNLTSAPNPFNPVTTIRFELPSASKVTLAVHDVMGRRVRTLADGREFDAGLQRMVWDGRDDAGLRVASGVYFALVRTEAAVDVRKMMLLK